MSTKRKKKSKKTWKKLDFRFVHPFGGGSFVLPTIPIPADFAPEEIVLVLWQLDGAGNPTVVSPADASADSKPAPGVYSIDTLPVTLQDPLSFACAASNGLLGQLGVKPSKGPYATPDMTEIDFAIQNQCYVVLLMTNTLSNCEFQYQAAAISTVLQQDQNKPKYFNLVHVVPGSPPGNCARVPGKNGWADCFAAYFSARPSDYASSDSVNYSFQFWPYGSIVWQPNNFDPSIKDTGHGVCKNRRFVLPGPRGRGSKRSTFAFVKTIIER